MHYTGWYLEEPVGNNAFSYEARSNKKLWVPELIEINHFDEIELGNEVVFEDFDFDDKLSTNF